VPEPHDAARDTPPCAQLLVLGGRVGELERRLDEHNRIQNSHLQDINRKLEGHSLDSDDRQCARSRH